MLGVREGRKHTERAMSWSEKPKMEKRLLDIDHEERNGDADMNDEIVVLGRKI